MKYSVNVLRPFEFAILATFFAKSTPIDVIPSSWIGFMNIPSLLPKSTSIESRFRFKSFLIYVQNL